MKGIVLEQMPYRDYVRYKVEAKRRGDEVFDRDSAEVWFRSSLYEAEAAEARTKKKITIASVIIAVVGIAGAGALWLPGLM